MYTIACVLVCVFLWGGVYVPILLSWACPYIYIFFCVLVNVSLRYVFMSVLSPMASFSYTELKASGLGSAHAGFF